MSVNIFSKKDTVAVLPTDTVMGLSCLATSKKAIDKIYKIKKRDKKKPLLVLVGSYCMLHDYFYVSAKQDKYLRTIWPRYTREIGENKKLKPTTVILRSRGKFPPNLSAGGENVAVRLPNDKKLAKLVMQIGSPIVSTSLNISGKPQLEDPGDIEKYFSHELPDLVVESKIKKNLKPSKLIDITDIRNIKILRR